MGLAFIREDAVLEGTVGVESAEQLLAWVREHPAGGIDLRGCTHMHAALLQVLMAADNPVAAWPDDEGLKSWLTAALTD